MIHFSNVGLRYRQGVEALREVSLSVEPGSLHFLTGRSGAGKSSLLRLLYFALRPTSGRLTLFGEDAGRIPRARIAMLRRRIGVVFQDFQLLDHLTVIENVALPLMVAGRREAEYRANVLEMLEWVKLTDKLHAKPAFLSGGEKQRVGIARAMVSVPDLILADEPTGSVDPEMGERILTLFAEMHRLGRTVIIATHDLAMVERYGAPRLHLEGGRLRRLHARGGPAAAPPAGPGVDHGVDEDFEPDWGAAGERRRRGSEREIERSGPVRDGGRGPGRSGGRGPDGYGGPGA